MNVIEAISRSRCFRGLDPRDTRDLVQGMEMRPFQRNQSVWRAEDRRSRLAFVADGRVKLVRYRSSGKALIVDIPGPGRLIDFNLNGDDSDTVEVVGLAQGSLISIGREEFLHQLTRHGAVAIKLAQEMARDRETLMVRFDEISAGSVEARLAALFYRLAREEGRESRDGVHLSLPLSRQDLADLVDTTIETAIRVMSRWNREERVLTLRDGFMIPDMEALEDLLE